MSGPLLSVEGLTVRYRGGDADAAHAVDLTVARGETVALVGESGSGKSTTAHAVLGLLPPTARITGGRIRLDGADLVGLGDRGLRAVRGRRIGLVPQDPGTSLNPVHRVGAQIAEALTAHGLVRGREAHDAAVGLLERVGVPDPALRARQYPHELSGGLRQRALIAMAIAAEPDLLIADEPTSALDVIVQRRILDHLSELAAERGIGLLLVTHDLGVAAERADRIVVMAGGRVVEDGPAARIIGAPRDRRTRALVAAAPGLGGLTAVPRAPSVVPKAADGPAHARLEGVTRDYRLRGGGTLRAVDGVDLDLARGETLALVGESGSGKSTVARILLRLAEPTAGRVLFEDRDVTALRGRDLRALRRRIQVVYQNPYASLNPRMTVERIIADPLVSFGIGNRAERADRVADLAELVALPPTLLRRGPAELSGGQRQRVAIARALAPGPDLLVCDEPVSALDATVQAQILDLLAGLQERLGLTCLFISHDLAVVRRLAHRIGVMRHGRLVELGAADDVLTQPAHPYTAALLAAVPGARVPAPPEPTK
ncbi:ABC transporter ATP-binding protein [Actinocorallia sp. API 0066]|uniref:dipeptide ABC transporter ATP-binding protein n=1 Tax=Actinocorallia sp. API 0066 TaxID=2896846 RepID=UPI001E3BCC86|nr:ABC transporter ATP-binding protein [Actinocorallia sp. API 0066]MCD0451630.1 ABC transporter ATP-binding protein [Actinocorallia sp. API 0066]